VQAVADALRTEYRAIVDHGLLLQIDAPDLAMERHTLFADRPLHEFLEWVDLDREHQSCARRDPPDRVRLHVCWGNYEGPHNHDVPLPEILAHLYEARPAPLSSRWPTPATPTSTAASSASLCPRACA
jgi:5-methyltetrahydropteroyltriglutamate--homocysteine methyltransferase